MQGDPSWPLTVTPLRRERVYSAAVRARRTCPSGCGVRALRARRVAAYLAAMRCLVVLLCLAPSTGGGPTAVLAPFVEAETPAPPPFDASVASLRVKQSTTVRSLPDEGSAPLGVLAQDMRVEWQGAAAGPGCERWIEIEPRGFVCER